jgi:hypothetical protein
MDCHWSKQVWFASPLGVVFNSHDSSYVSFQECDWKKYIINAAENVIDQVLALL